MARRSGLVALGAGFVVGGLVAIGFGLVKSEELKRRGQQLAHSLTEQGSSLETYLASQGTRISTELERIARDEVERSARQTADTYMATRFGLTPERIAGITRLAAAAGPLGELFG